MTPTHTPTPDPTQSLTAPAKTRLPSGPRAGKWVRPLRRVPGCCAWPAGFARSRCCCLGRAARGISGGTSVRPVAGSLRPADSGLSGWGEGRLARANWSWGAAVAESGLKSQRPSS